MVINDLMDLIKKLFDDDYEDIVIVNSSDREEYEADKMTVKELKSLTGVKVIKTQVLLSSQTVRQRTLTP